jgi:hypothetical protein
MEIKKRIQILIYYYLQNDKTNAIQRQLTKSDSLKVSLPYTQEQTLK